MNERIRELKNKVLDEHFSHTWTTMSYQDVEKFADKFAELIVLECMDCADWVGKINTVPVEPINTAHTIKKRIKQHFGVE